MVSGNSRKTLAISIAVGALFLLGFFALGIAVTNEVPLVLQFNEVGAAAIQSLRSDELNALVIPFTGLMDPQIVIVVCLVVIALLVIFKRFDLFKFFAAFAIIDHAFIYSLKAVFHVQRPFDQMIIPVPITDSFPSAHTASALCLALAFSIMICTILAEKRGKSTLRDVMIIGLFVCFAILIALSRIYVGVHWCTDIVGGWMITLSTAIPIITWFKLSDSF